jgi:hypothetical protein
MNANLFPLSLVAAVALLIVPQTSEGAICTFDVDASSGIGTGSFEIDLPELWPPPPLIFGDVRTTVIPASSVRGFFARGDKWIALSVSLKTFLEKPNSAELSGTCKKAGTFKTPPSISGLSPIEAIASLPGVTLRDRVVTQSEINRQRRNQLLERNILLKASANRSRQNSRLTLENSRPIAVLLPPTSKSPAP